VSPAFLIRINASLEYASDSENIYEEIRDDNNKGTATDSGTLIGGEDPSGGSGGGGSGSGGLSSGGSGSGGGGGSDGLKARVQTQIPYMQKN